ncbi:Kin of IRRE-like protein 2, partial [Clonorchis sinensis]
MSLSSIIKLRHLHNLCLTLMLFLWRSNYAMADLSNSPNPTGTLLKGPVNQSVLIGKTARFQCRIHDRHLYGISPDELGQSFNKQLIVQWIIDGFGVTNETLKSVYGSRYHMPGPADQGIYDLLIHEISLEDEASFICQADVKLYKASPPPLIETLASKPVYLKIIIPPTSLTLARRDQPTRYQELSAQFPGSKLDRSHIISESFVHSPFQANQKPLDTGTVHLSPRSKQFENSRIVADDPAIGSGFHVYKPVLLENTRKLNLTDTSGEQMRIAKPPPVLWIREQERLTVECRSSAAKPAPTIRWFLSGVPLDPTKGERASGVGSVKAPMHDALDSQSSGRLSQVEVDEKFEIVEQHFFEPVNYTAAFVHHPLPQHSSARNASPDGEVHTRATLSVLQLLVQRRHQQKHLECKIDNTDEFRSAVLPSVFAVIEPMYVERIDVKIQAAGQTEEMREGTTAQVQCIAITNPPSPVYSWTILDPPAAEVPDDYNNKSTSVSQYTNDITSRDRLLNAIPQDPSVVQLKLHRSMHRSRVRCWVGVGVPGEDIHRIKTPESSSNRLMWKRMEKELNILYGPAFEQGLDNIRPAKLGQTIYLECTVDSNPLAHVALYRIGPRGQAMLTELCDQDDDPNNQSSVSRWQNVNAKHSQYIGAREISPSALANAVKSKGSEILHSAVQKVRYPLRLKRMEDFGFYACIANTPSFAPALQPLYVGHSGSPRVTNLRQLTSNDGSQIDLVCLIKSIPRPTMDHVHWFRHGKLIQPTERIQILHEQLILGLRSILHFRHVQLEDVALYNCTITNEYGTAWKTIQLEYGASIPLVFIAGTGVALFLAILFVVLLCCFFRLLSAFPKASGPSRTETPKGGSPSSEYLERTLKYGHVSYYLTMGVVLHFPGLIRGFATCVWDEIIYPSHVAHPRIESFKFAKSNFKPSDAVFSIVTIEQSNGIQLDHTVTNSNFRYEMELQPMLATSSSECNLPLTYDPLNLQTCHLCLNAVKTCSDSMADRTPGSQVCATQTTGIRLDESGGCPHM